MIIDINTRIGRHPIHEFEQSPEKLIEIMDEHGISRSFLLPFATMKIKENNEKIAKAVEEYSDHFTGFACINPLAENAIKEVEHAVSIGLKGVMLDPEFHKFMSRGLSNVEKLMVPCMDHSLPVLFNTENIRYARPEPYYKGMNQLAFKFPDVRMVVNKNWPRLAELLRWHHNLIVYTGGHHGVPGVVPIVEELGPTRICLGSESPVNHPALTIRDINVKKIAPEYRELILGKNAERLFKDLL